MKKTIVQTALATLFVFGLNYSSSAQKQSGTQFYKGSFDNLLRDAKKQNKTILLDFYASWCQPCHRLDSETFANKNFGDFANKNILVYKVDIETKDGQEIVDKYNIKVFPSMLLINAKRTKLSEFKGFYPPNFLQKEIAKVADVNGIYMPAPSQTLMAKK